MALYAFDGTWCEDEPEPGKDSNVVKFKSAYRGTCEYIEGVGTRFGALGCMLGGLFGTGGKTRIEEMYEKLIVNWQNGDHDIDIIGFSRGAALAVHFSNVISKVGIRVDNAEIARPEIRFLGLWDIVGSFGVPINIVLKFQEINIGYDLNASENVLHCFHAMALNERRQTFQVTRLDTSNQSNNIEELWFRGVHSDVGGGNENEALSNIPLQWIMDKGELCGLPIDESDIRSVASEIDATAAIGENLDLIKNPRRTIYPSDQFHPSAQVKTLGIGESASFKVHAKEQYSWSGVQVESGGYYIFIISDGQKWKDASIECGPDGWRTEDLPWYKEKVFEFLESKRRCPNANWFELIGAISDEDNNFFRIGNGGEQLTYQAQEDGELFLFANDLRTTYGNNHGEIKVVVRRASGPGESSLKNCEEV
ncbi:MAG: DUF2235 domain-containing protein [Candidatus Brocadiales bacterium]|nr:DUF2235 domain-containing protein [Candidatus Brocadiales bacterium]